jgi:sugar/nucleoside kinase (ribokinase family)
MVRFSKDYELGDVIVVFQQRPWQSWAELVDWLKANGPQFDWLTPGEIARMLADFSVLNDENIPFVSDPGEAYELAQAHRRTDAVLRAMHWIEDAQALVGGDTDLAS